MIDFNLPFAISLPFPAFILSPTDEKILWLNDPARQWIGFNSTKAINKRIHEIFSAALGEHVLKLPSPEQAYVYERNTEFHLPNGEICKADYSIFHYDHYFGLIFLPQGQFSVADPEISESAVSSLGRMLAHELKNPLAGIRGASQILAMSRLDEDQKEMAELIASEVDRLSRIITNIEKLSSNSKSHFKALNIHEIIDKSVAIFKAQPAFIHTLKDNFDPSLPQIYGDEDQLVQVFCNLIANAKEAMDELEHKGRLTIKTRYQSGVKSRSSSSKPIDVPIVVKIIDSGPGFKKNIKGGIFDPFITSKQNGQGLGLSLVNQIIRNHKGLIEAGRVKNETVFTLRFPIYNGENHGDE